MTSNLRKPRLERLENRTPCAVDVFDWQADNWHNESNEHDVDGDGYRAPLDALVLVNFLNHFGTGEVESLKEQWVDRTDPLPEGRFHPDVNQDQSVTSFDVLELINRLNRPSTNLQAGNAGEIIVVPDPSGRPLRVEYSSSDGRSKQVDLSEMDVVVTWNGDDVLIANQEGMPVVIAKPSAGILHVEYLGEEGTATVTKYEENGKEVTETYVCVPGWNGMWVETFPVLDVEFIVEVEPDDVRRPIPEFDEVLGAIVLRRIVYADETTILHEYEEATVEELLSVTVTLPSGESMTVDFAQPTGEPPDLAAIEAALLELLRQGFRTPTAG